MGHQSLLSEHDYDMILYMLECYKIFYMQILVIVIIVVNVTEKYLNEICANRVNKTIKHRIL